MSQLNPSSNSNASVGKSQNYWLCVVLDGGIDGNALSSGLMNATSIEWRISKGFVAANLGADWVGSWNRVRETLPTLNADKQKLALIPSPTIPSDDEVKFSAREPLEIAKIADNYWLMEYLDNDRIECHFQSVVDKNREIFGWESFARVQLDNGELISGFKIIEASKALNIKHLVDRQLLSQAVRDFATFDLRGNLFLNFIPDFIQRPEKYLEGIEDAARRYNVLTRRLVLEFPVGDKTLNHTHIKAVTDFCRSKGFRVSLDDIVNPSGCEKHIADFSPDYVKLDRSLASSAANRTRELSSLINFAHSKNCRVLAEGIEEESVFSTLKDMNVDLFQGYYFSKPERPQPKK